MYPCGQMAAGAGAGPSVPCRQGCSRHRRRSRRHLVGRTLRARPRCRVRTHRGRLRTGPMTPFDPGEGRCASAVSRVGCATGGTGPDGDRTSRLDGRPLKGRRGRGRTYRRVGRSGTLGLGCPNVGQEDSGQRQRGRRRRCRWRAGRGTLWPGRTSSWFWSPAWLAASWTSRRGTPASKLVETDIPTLSNALRSVWVGCIWRAFRLGQCWWR